MVWLRWTRRWCRVGKLPTNAVYALAQAVVPLGASPRNSRSFLFPSVEWRGTRVMEWLAGKIANALALNLKIRLSGPRRGQ